MKRTLVVVVLPLLLMGLMASAAMADASGSQTVTCCILPLNLLLVDPIGPINVGQSGETNLKWNIDESDGKVFVRIDHLPTGLKLKVEALTRGFWGQGKHQQPPVSAGEVTFANTEQRELISVVGRSDGGCKIRYTAEAASVAEPGTSGVIEVSYILTTANGAPLSVSSHQLIIGQGLPLGGGDQAVTYGEVVYITIMD